MSRPAAYRVFLTHGREDTFLVEDYIVPKLETSEATLFLDSGAINYGDDFRSRLFAELAAADELFVLLTVTSIERPWVFAEVGAAIIGGKRIVPVRYGPREDQLQALGVLSLLGNVTLLEFEDLDDYVKQLTRRVAEKSHG